MSFLSKKLDIIKKMLITEKNVESKIKELENLGYTWKPLGGNANNEGLIQMLTDPGAGLAERVTNAIDAVLEKHYLALPSQAASPNDLATEIKKQIPRKSFENLIDVAIYNSESLDSNKSITTVITDKGIGISGNEFEETILKLSGDNKLTKKYLMGSYGQGGSTSIKFNEFTVIHSRNDKGEEAMTIIRYNLGTKDMKNGSYEYIAKETNGASHFATSKVLQETGTQIINVATYYKKRAPKVEYQKTIHTLLTNRLFHPPLPFTLTDKRKNTIDTKRVLIEGARNNLDAKIKDPQFYDQKAITTMQGSIVYIRWWVIMPKKSERPKNLVDAFLKTAQWPFNFTMNGQTQGYFGNALLNDSELSFLKKRFVCEIDLTMISKREKRSILSSSRENISPESDFWEELRVKIMTYFTHNQKLQKINKEIREMMTSLALDDKSFNKKLSKELRNLVSLFAKGQVRSAQEIKKLDQNNEQQPEVEDLKIIPTYFNFKALDPHEFSGDKLRLRYETDGDPNIVLNQIAIIDLPVALKFISKKQKARNGVITFDAREMLLNENVPISFDILNGTFIKKVIVRKIDPLEKPKKPGYPKTEVFLIKTENDSNYTLHDFTKQKPCIISYSKQTNNLKIYINLATYDCIGNYLKKHTTYQKFLDYYSMGLSIYVVSQIKKYEHENTAPSENYDYNPIAKNLVWSFENMQNIK